MAKAVLVKPLTPKQMTLLKKLATFLKGGGKAIYHHGKSPRVRGFDMPAGRVLNGLRNRGLVSIRRNGELRLTSQAWDILNR